MSDEQMLKHLAYVARTRYKLTVWQWKPGYVGGHASHSLHYLTFPDGVGRAFDAYGSYLRMARYALWVRRHHRHALTEGIFNGRFPVSRLSVSNGRGVPGSFWGAVTWREHRNHVHIGI